MTDLKKIKISTFLQRVWQPSGQRVMETDSSNVLSNIPNWVAAEAGETRGEWATGFRCAHCKASHSAPARVKMLN